MAREKNTAQTPKERYISGDNTSRILYSNDGLIFISYDNAQTFMNLSSMRRGHK